MSLRNQLIKVFKAALGLCDYDLVIGRKFFRVCTAENSVDFRKVIDMLGFTELFHHLDQNERKLPCIVAGSVVIERSKFQMVCNGIELMVFDIRIH